MSGDERLFPLVDNQRRAVEPEESVWLSASAGTGKTQVLSARVLRLLLQSDVHPSQILCLTFTKAGAAEMAVRIKQVLARWVRSTPTELAADLMAIDADFGPETQKRARTLFASVLDCPGGGLRIDTIHAFAQWLLAAFPQEAGLEPGVRAMEDAERELLQREVLAELLLEAEERGDSAHLAALAGLSRRFGADAVQTWLMRCAQAWDLWSGPGGWQDPLRPAVERTLGLPVGAGEAEVAALCEPARFAETALRRCLEVNEAVGGKKGGEATATIGEWLSSTPATRAASIEMLAEVFLTKAGKPRATTSQEKVDSAYPTYVDQVLAAIDRVRTLRGLIALADWLTPALSLGRAFALAWDRAKTREGLIDFDDQIRRAARLLNGQTSSDWIRYKLDRRFDHILVDEAQDTNAAQWDIIKALTDDFFSGEGARDGKLRTIFVVGDYKQAIFRFQGTSPENFEAARRFFEARMDEAAANAEALREEIRVRRLEQFGLAQSFRTADNVLGFVDQAIEAIGFETFGLPEKTEPHKGQPRPGLVTFWKPVGFVAEPEDEEGDAEGEGWLSLPERQLANRIALQVRDWLEHGFALVKGDKPRRATAGDVMVLVRKRKELAGLIVARLHAAGVPVAGVDRLRLGAPLAVRDLMAALRFAAQPFDDLNLASLLVSPLLGWTQDDLLAHAFRDKHLPLWSHLRRRREPLVLQTLDKLHDLLARADYEPPQAILHWLLVGPWRGRKALVHRLGFEANDPIDELVSAAHSYAVSATASLAGFIAWFDSNDGDIKREAAQSGGQVRVMTVHGSKGLQAPIVILADAASNPHGGRVDGVDLRDPLSDPSTPRLAPIPPLGKVDRLGPIAEAAAAAARGDFEEHWRLLYVAMTRAEEALFVTGSLASRERAPSPDSWYARLEALMPPERKFDDPRWGYRLVHGAENPVPAAQAERWDEATVQLPAWALAPVGPEPSPPRPLAPSSLGEDSAPEPPFPPGAGQEAARRGTLIHKLLERLPELPENDRAEAAERWLVRNAADLVAEARREIVSHVQAVLADPQWADVFGEGSLAEVPVAALAGKAVIAGTIDRILIAPDRIRIVDFKTARRPPAGLDQIPAAVVAQMAAYVLALEAAFPGRKVEAAVLYTQTPQLIAIPDALLAARKAKLLAQQELL